MSRMLSYVAAPDDAGQRLDALLAARGLYPSRSAAARAVDDGLVFVNGAEVAKKHPVAPGDTIVYQVEEPVEPGPLRGQPIDLDIRFEDEDSSCCRSRWGSCAIRRSTMTTARW